MSDRPPAAPPDTAHESHGCGISERRSTTQRPRWVTAVAIVIVALVLLGLILLHLGGGLGPGLHGGS